MQECILQVVLSCGLHVFSLPIYPMFASVSQSILYLYYRPDYADNIAQSPAMKSRGSLLSGEHEIRNTLDSGENIHFL